MGLLIDAVARHLAFRQSTLNALIFEALNKRDHVALFGLGHLELRQGRRSMTEEHVPVAWRPKRSACDLAALRPWRSFRRQMLEAN